MQSKDWPRSEVRKHLLDETTEIRKKLGVCSSLVSAYIASLARAGEAEGMLTEEDVNRIIDKLSRAQVDVIQMEIHLQALRQEVYDLL